MGKKNPYYDSLEFYNRWHSAETIESIADSLEINPIQVWRAAKRRGFSAKRKARGNIKYKERTKC